jgi:hypothetical protein
MPAPGIKAKCRICLEQGDYADDFVTNRPKFSQTEWSFLNEFSHRKVGA